MKYILESKFLPVLALFSLFMLGSVNEAKACHALPIDNFQVEYIIDGGTGDTLGITIDGESNSATCGCSNIYWMDIEIRCLEEPFDGAAFAPAFYGPLDTHPYFQSDQLNKTGCNQEAYPQTTVSFVPGDPNFSDLCPGVEYKVRVRENHNSDVGTWSTPQTFVYPGSLPVFNLTTLTADPNPVCPGEDVDLEVQTTGGCGLAIEYEWYSAPDDNGSPLLPWTFVGNGNPITVTPSQDTWYKVVATDLCSEQSDSTGNGVPEILVEMLPPPDAGTASISDTVVCQGETVDLDLVDEEGDIQWQISTNNGATWSNIAGQTSNSFTSNPINVTTCFRAEVSGCNQINYTDELCVTMSPFPTADFDFDGTCSDYPTEFTDQSSANADTYSWDFGDGFGSTDSDPTYEYPETGDYEVTLIVLNEDGCGDTISKPITIYRTPEAGFISDSVCFLELNPFTNTSELNDPFDDDEITNYNWTFGDGNTSTQENPNHGYVEEGVYTVTLITTTNNGCSDTITSSATVWPLPQPEIDFDDNCQLTPVDFEDLSTISNQFTQNDIVAWDWNFGDGNTSTEQNPTNIYQDVGGYEINFTAISSNGCENSLTDSINIIEITDVSFFNDPTGGHIPLEVDFYNTSSGSDSYEFDFGNGDTDWSETPDTITVWYYEPGTYTIVLTGENEFCSNQDTAILIVDDYPDLEFNIPNVFTPNNDGVNDLLHFDLDNVARVEVRIYNRWGNLVGLVTSSKKEDGWDGRHRETGQPVTDGVYFYTYEFHALNGEIIDGHSYVHLKR